MDQAQTERFTEKLAELAHEFELEDYVFMAAQGDDFILDINSNMVGALGLIEFAKLELLERKNGGPALQAFHSVHN